MGLSNDLISQFVKMTNDKKETNDRSSAYGTVVEYNGTSYVKFDGSDLLTPVDSSIVLHDKDRVIVDINKHTAVATGNLSNPSVSGVEITQTEGKLRVEFEQGLKNLELYFKDEMAKLDIGFADGIHSGITSVDKDGIKVQHTAYNGYTHMCYDGFYINYGGSDVLKCTSSGLVYTGTITASVIQSSNGAFRIDQNGNISGASLTSSQGGNFSIDENGQITAASLAVEGNVSTNTIICNDISNKAYPKTLTGTVTLYVDGNSGSDDNTCVNGALFKTLKGAIDSIPKFLNGKTVNIRLVTNPVENVSINYFTGGRIYIYLDGRIIYGTVSCSYNSAPIYFYGGDSTSSTKYGEIHPSVGLNVGSRSGAININQSTSIGFYYINLFGPDTQASGLTGDIVGMGVQGGSYVYASYIAIYNCDVGFRANSVGWIHVNTSSGVASKYGFQASTGGTISLANNQQAGGNTASTKQDSGGKVHTDNCSFVTGDTSSSGNKAPTTTTTSTKTYTASSAQALQYAGTSSAFWRTDCLPKAGDWGYGAHTGWWFFGDDFEDMASKTVTKVEITFTRNKAGNHAATSHNFYVHNYETQPSTKTPTYNTSKIASASVAVNNSYTMTITDSTIINRIKSAKGICCVPPSQSSTYYSVMSATMKVKFTYKG
jgi:hypothetical protein